MSVKISSKQPSQVVHFFEEHEMGKLHKSRKMLICMGKKGCRRFINSSDELKHKSFFYKREGIHI